uniref:Uncharacterized protein LOC100180334 n=1 Tax=Phallusia mammillata TaxID=59560 RepID=A0A6F9DHQ7_9ASCI|nr:uncharacterized protein LOC100180334 [Phallusia mammillata]
MFRVCTQDICSVRLLAKSCSKRSSSVSTMYQLIGGELSPYTAKVRSYLRYKKIPFEPVQATADTYARFIKPKVGWSVIPVLVTPDKCVIQDSTEIISYLEKRHPNPTILPQTPRQKIVASLIELFSDEWMVQPAMHYRWSFKENMPFVQEEFGRIAFPSESAKNRSEIAQMVYKKFKGMLPTLGITEKTFSAIEKSWESTLDDMSRHFDKHPYFLGGQPCIGDFAMGGMMYAHLFRDPMPGFLMKTRAPLVAAWTEQMNGHLKHANKLHLHEVDANGWIIQEVLPQEKREFLPNDEIPDTLLPILKRFFTEFGPVLLNTKKHLTVYIEENVTPNKTKLPRTLGKNPYTIGDATEMRDMFPFNVWMWQHVVDLYQSLPSADQASVLEFVKQFPHGSDIVAADLSNCRVTRISNFLQGAQKQSKL